MASGALLKPPRITALLIFLLTAGLSTAQPPEPAPAKASKMTIYNGASRYVTYFLPPDASPHLQALYRALGQAENDQYLADQLQQLLLEYTEQERILGNVRTSRELLYGFPAGAGGYGYTSPDGVTKALTVTGLVAAADARAEFAGRVNRSLERLQEEVADATKAGGLSARDALRKESIALGKQRQAWQTHQAAVWVEEVASRLVEKARQKERQAAAGHQTWLDRLLCRLGWPTVCRRLAEAIHQLAQRVTNDANRRLQKATKELHAAQKESQLAIQRRPAPPGLAVAPASKSRPAVPMSPGPGQAGAQDELVKAVRLMQRQVSRNVSSIPIARAEQMAAAAARNGFSQERDAWLKERDALVKERDADASLDPKEFGSVLAARLAEQQRLAGQWANTRILQPRAAARSANVNSLDPSNVTVRPLNLRSTPVLVSPQMPVAEPVVPDRGRIDPTFSGIAALLLIVISLPIFLRWRRP
jgi:hypothetical protein